MASPALTGNVPALDRFDVHMKIFSFPRRFAVYDAQGGMVAFCKKSAFKLKEETRIFADEGMTREIMTTKARSMINFNGAYDVTDSATGQRVGVLQRKGLKSLIQDEWMIKDANEVEIGAIQEDSTVLALVRRFVTHIIPQTFNFYLAGQQVGSAAQNWNFFAPKLTCDFSADAQRKLDRRLALAAVIQLMVIEGRQSEE